MERTYFARLVEVCPVLDGKVVEVEDTTAGIIAVIKLAGMPVASGSLFVNRANIKVLPDFGEVDPTNPYGELVESWQWADATATVTVSVYAEKVHFHVADRFGRSLGDYVTNRARGLRLFDLVKSEKSSGAEAFDALFTIRGGDNGTQEG